MQKYVIANIAMLMAIDSTQGDYYSLFGQAFYQRWRFNPKSEEFMLEAIKNIDIAIEKKNINNVILMKFDLSPIKKEIMKKVNKKNINNK